MSTTSWKIPQNLLPLPEKMLLIYLHRWLANVYIVSNGEVHTGEMVQTPETDYHYSDREGLSFSRGSSNGTSPGTEGHNEAHYDQVFGNYFEKSLALLVKAENAQRIIIFVPEDMKHFITEKIPAALKDSVEFHVGNMAHISPLELLERLQK